MTQNPKNNPPLQWRTLAPQIRGALSKIHRAGRNISQPVYIVGGLVRDWILGTTNMDLDVVSEGPVFDLAEAFAILMKGRLVFYKPFLTATVVCPNGLSVDFATARREIYPHPGALPRVFEGTLREDLFRRDFTINALAVRLGKGRLPEIVDFYNGLEDLRARRIRILHRLSFRDDPTRILRAIRFAVRLGFRFEKETAQLLREAVAENYPSSVKPGRYLNEFRKVFSEPAPWPCLKGMKAWQALEALFPDLEFDTRLLNRLAKSLETLNEPNGSAGLRQSIWFMGMMTRYTGQSRDQALTRLPFTREERGALLAMEKTFLLMARLRQKNLKPSQIYQFLSPLAPEIILFIRAASSDKIVGNYIDQYWRQMSRQTLSLSGQDLFAIKPGISGQEVGRILRQIFWRKLDGEAPNRRDEIRLARALLGETK